MRFALVAFESEGLMNVLTADWNPFHCWIKIPIVFYRGRLWHALSFPNAGAAGRFVTKRLPQEINCLKKRQNALPFVRSLKICMPVPAKMYSYSFSALYILSSAMDQSNLACAPIWVIFT